MTMNSGQRAVLKGLVLIGSLVAVTLFLRAMDLDSMLDANWADEHLRGPAGPALFLLFTALFTGAGLPRQISSFLGGYAFGLVGGTLLSLFGGGLGCALAFFYARLLGQDFIKRRRARKIQKFNEILSTNPFSTALILRFLPVGSNLLTNLVAGVSNVPASWFLLGSLVGYIPQTVVFTLLGTGVRLNSFWTTALSVALFIVSTLLGVLLYRRNKTVRGLDNGDNGTTTD